MKKIFALLLSLSLALFGLAGCATTPPSGNKASGDAVKTGLAIISSIAKSVDVTAKDGAAQVDSTVVAVTVDKNGKILKCKIDAAQTVINFNAKGKITTPLDTVFVAKQELGEKYGMKKASSIGKEWSEEATALADYVVGKTIDEVKGIAVNEAGAPANKELSSSVTISIGGYISAIEKAVTTAQDIGAKATDKLGLGINTTIAGSKDATTADGLAQAYSYYTATTFGTDGKISSCVADASQTNVNFNAVGKITTDLKTTLQTKNELGDIYGMKKASSIGKEWNEQAAAFAKYIVGKTLDQVKGISVNDKKEPTDAELKGSVTISIGDFITVLEKANANAK